MSQPPPSDEVAPTGGGLEVYRPAALSVPEVRELVGDLVNTDFVPSALRGKPGAVLACILTGQELGVGAMTSLAKVHVIEGRPALSGELMRAIILRAGHSLWLEESSATRVVLAGSRREAPEHITRITWTLDDAKKAQLDGKAVWKKYPRAMLTARATGELARMVFPDVLAGISYTKEELDDGFTLDEDAPPVEGGIPEGAPEGAAPPPAARPTRTAPDAGRSRAPRPDVDEASVDPDDDVVDAVIVEGGEERLAPEEAAVAPETPAEEADAPKGSGMTPAQYAAMRATEAGLTDAERHGVYVAVTSGRTSSGADLTGQERDDAIEHFAKLKAGDLVLGRNEVDGAVEWTLAPADDPEDWIAYGAAPHVSPSEGTEADTPPPSAEAENAHDGASEADESQESRDEPDLGTEDGWRTYIKAESLRLPDVLRAAKAIAGQPGMSLGELAGNPDLTARVVDHFKRATS